jgi:hypothetical protein
MANALVLSSLKVLNMEEPNHINVPIVAEDAAAPEGLEVLRRVEILGQPAFPAFALLPDAHA